MTPSVSSKPAVSDELAETLERLLRVSLRTNAPGDLSLSTAAALSTIARVGPMRLTELTALEHLTQPAMTQLVTRLERDGLAERRPDPEDGRAVLVTITDAGRMLIAARRATRAERVAAFFDELPAEDRASIIAALPALGRLAAVATKG